jgi:dipeptidase E
MKKYPQTGLGVDNCCAMIFKDDTYRVIGTKDSANAYRIYKQDGKVREEVIEKSRNFRPMEELYRTHRS